MNSSASRRTALEAKYARENSELFNLVSTRQIGNGDSDTEITAEMLMSEKRERRRNKIAQRYEAGGRRPRSGTLEQRVNRELERQGLATPSDESVQQKKLRMQTFTQMSKVRTASAHNFRMREKRNTSTDYLSKMDRFRTNENERRDLDIRVAEYKYMKDRQRLMEQQRLHEERKVIIQRNINDVHMFAPEVQQEISVYKAKEKKEKMEFTRETKRFIDQSRIERTLDQIQEREDRQSERERLRFLQPFTEAWLNLVVLANRSECLRRMYEIIQATRLERENQKQQEMFMSGGDIIMNMNGRVITAEQLKAEQDRAFKTKFAFPLYKVRRILRKPILQWRENKRTQYRGMLVQFVNDIHETFRIPLAIRKFKRSVQLIQQNFRGHRIRSVSRLILLKRQFDSFILARLHRIDYLMLNEDQKASGKQTKVSALAVKRVGRLAKKSDEKKFPSNKKPLREYSFKNLDPVTRFKDGGEGNKRFFELMAEKEELKKIPESVKIELLRESLKLRLKEYVKMYSRYKTRLEEQRHATMKGTIEQHMPRFRVLLDKEDLRLLLNKAWQLSKLELLKKREEFMLQSGYGGLGSGNSTVTGEILARLNHKNKKHDRASSPTSSTGSVSDDDNNESNNPAGDPELPSNTPSTVKSLANVLIMKRRLVSMAQGARSRVSMRDESNDSGDT
jgi:hypothetical protein